MNVRDTITYSRLAAGDPARISGGNEEAKDMTLRAGSDTGTRASSDRPIEQCAYCGRSEPTGEGCTTDTITFPDGVIEEAIAYGEERGTQSAERCPGCGVSQGGYHHPFCPEEECPRCGRGLMRCGCLDTDRVWR